MRGSVNLLQGFTRILGVLLTRSRSLYAALIIFAGMGLADFLFRTYLFPVYTDFLLNIGANADWTQLDVGFAPIVWLSFFAIVLGSLTIVITFAAQNVPKLIDLYMDHWPSLLFVWWSAACLVHVLSIKVLSEGGIQIIPSLVFNFHVLLAVSLAIGFPFVFSILRSTKTSNVIENLLNGSYSTINILAAKGSTGKISAHEHAKIQYQLFEGLNQLIDLLVYVPFKEPKAQVIEGIGALLRHYVQLKPKIPDSFFKVDECIHDDISFRTMKSLMAEVEKTRTFYEQKSVRLIGNVYNVFLDTGEFDLSTLCVEQLSQVGKTAIACDDQELIDVITVRLNTHFRFALKHGQHHNEPRNLYNLVFHYGQFIGYLMEYQQVDRIKTCIGYFVFYGQQCFNVIQRAKSLAFILDVLAFEMQKLMLKIYQEKWDRELQEEMLQKFLVFDNFQDMDKNFAVQFFSQNHGIRLLHIGLALFYLNQQEDEFAEKIAKDTVQDMDLMGATLFNKTMTTIYARLQFSGPTFWEDTDRGNLNIYYTPYQDEISSFKKIQQELLLENKEKIPA
ncbi:MAG: hypothetical protein QGG03_03450 [SAR324 cluster bacterium]|jgi:hypothetical protein|uniref:DUF2254 domain-containing protein n=1 Tax=marine metagenome TaxID=408172 RepID=A0A381QFL3_9ZZZZ|nr:hypothetical protein [Deltaproteobacteria bacterium]MDP6488154.1 hypothetical protein [SAR324 cluster bacterium]MDP7582271.1 hypothetical protein [SAR324 cluster bacterium]HBR60611.1 hypothetical protein [Deltaproteobacteria bacterium]|tara:strand:+ start:1296 stop:2978 length:1683 start_codon:yes stop_codon:yes gene_type:complete